MRNECALELGGERPRIWCGARGQGGARWPYRREKSRCVGVDREPKIHFATGTETCQPAHKPPAANPARRRDTHRASVPQQPSQTTAHTPFNSHPHHPPIEPKRPPFRGQPQGRSLTGVEFAWMFPKTSGRDRHGDRGHLLGTTDMKLPVLAPQILSPPPPIHRLPPDVPPGPVAGLATQTRRRTRHPDRSPDSSPGPVAGFVAWARARLDGN